MRGVDANYLDGVWVPDNIEEHETVGDSCNSMYRAYSWADDDTNAVLTWRSVVAELVSTIEITSLGTFSSGLLVCKRCPHRDNMSASSLLLPVMVPTWERERGRGTLGWPLEERGAPEIQRETAMPGMSLDCPGAILPDVLFGWGRTTVGGLNNIFFLLQR